MHEIKLFLCVQSMLIFYNRHSNGIPKRRDGVQQKSRRKNSKEKIPKKKSRLNLRKYYETELRVENLEAKPNSNFITKIAKNFQIKLIFNNIKIL